MLAIATCHRRGCKLGWARATTTVMRGQQLVLAVTATLGSQHVAGAATAITFEPPVLVANWSDSPLSQSFGPSGVSPATFYALSESTFVGNENNVNSLWSYSTDTGSTWAHVRSALPEQEREGCCPMPAVTLRPDASPSPFFAAGFHGGGFGRLGADTAYETHRFDPLYFTQTASGALNISHNPQAGNITFSGVST